MKKVLITGGSRGIGAACVEAFAADDWEVVAISRGGGTAAGPRVGWLHFDMEAAEWPDLPTEVNVLILNAATYLPGGLLDSDRDPFSACWPLNVLANHRMARAVLPNMIERGNGHLVVIGSVGTDHPPAHATAYAATKYALRGLYESWKAELAGSGVKLTLISPGPTRTSSWDGETMPEHFLEPKEVAARVVEAVDGGIEGRLLMTGRQ